MCILNIPSSAAADCRRASCRRLSPATYVNAHLVIFFTSRHPRREMWRGDSSGVSTSGVGTFHGGDGDRGPVRMWSTKAEREQMETLADLFAIITAAEKLEKARGVIGASGSCFRHLIALKRRCIHPLLSSSRPQAYVRDIVSPSVYETECYALLAKFKTLRATLGVSPSRFRQAPQPARSPRLRILALHPRCGGSMHPPLPSPLPALRTPLRTWSDSWRRTASTAPSLPPGCLNRASLPPWSMRAGGWRADGAKRVVGVTPTVQGAGAGPARAASRGAPRRWRTWCSASSRPWTA